MFVSTVCKDSNFISLYKGGRRSFFSCLHPTVKAVGTVAALVENCPIFLFVEGVGDMLLQYIDNQSVIKAWFLGCKSYAFAG